MTARNRKPTGKPPWPRMLLSGEEGARKSWEAAKLSADKRIGGMFWLEIGDGEVTADEYGAIPGVKYDIIEHDGTWLDIDDQLSEHWNLAKAAEEAGELPIALGVDAMSGVHSMLYEMADTRARRKLADQLRKKGQDPDLAWSSERDVSITPDLHALVKKRHKQFMRKVLTWPGPVVLISRERVATVFDAQGQPTKEKDWTLEAKKDLGNQCTAWIRMTRGNPPLVIKLRSVRHGIMPDEDTAVARRDFSCAALVFDWVGCESGVSRAPETRELNADQVMPDEAAAPEEPQPTRARRPAPEDIERQAANGVRYIVTADTADKASKMLATAKDSIARNADVTAQLTEDDREVLGLAEGEQVTLLTLAERVERYVAKHSRAVRAALDAAPAEAPASKASAA